MGTNVATIISQASQLVKEVTTGLCMMLEKPKQYIKVSREVVQVGVVVVVDELK